MDGFNKEDLAKEIIELGEIKAKKKHILIECFQEIENALNKGASLEEVLEVIEKKTGIKMHLKYAYLVLQEQREGQKKAVKPNHQPAPVKSVVVEPIKTVVIEETPVKAEEVKPEAKKMALNDFIAMPVNELPEMIKPYAIKVIDGIEYDVRQASPPYAVFGSSSDEFEFAEKMRDAGYSMKSDEYKAHKAELMAKKKLRGQYFDAHRDFKSLVIRYEKTVARPTETY